MTNLEVYYRLVKTDLNGRTVEQTEWRKCRSFVLQFLQYLEFTLAHEYAVFPTMRSLSIKDVGNTSRTTYVSASTYLGVHFAIGAPDNTSSYGIVVGSGTNATSNSDYALQTQIAHGTGSGQLDYGAHSWTDAAVVGSNVDLILSRSFYNGSGNTVGINEVGVYYMALTSGGATSHCMIRDVLSSTFNVANTQTCTVQYTLRTTV